LELCQGGQLRSAAAEIRGKVLYNWIDREMLDKEKAAEKKIKRVQLQTIHENTYHDMGLSQLSCEQEYSMSNYSGKELNSDQLTLNLKADCRHTKVDAT